MLSEQIMPKSKFNTGLIRKILRYGKVRNYWLENQFFESQ
jgi:hypothetical protein